MNYELPALDAVAGNHYEGQRLNPKRFGADIFENFYHWVHKKQPNSGAMEYAFETYAINETSPIDHAISVRHPFSSIAGSPQLYVSQFVPTAGLGGLVQGQMISQPLYDPYSNSFSGAPAE